jgi:hypothetical protein
MANFPAFVDLALAEASADFRQGKARRISQNALSIQGTWPIYAP